MDQPWIGVDLDGTLAHYDEWRGIEHIGPPIEEMRLRVVQWLAEGHDVRILTARVGPQRHDVPHTIAEITRHIEDWCRTHLGQVLRVTSQKDYCMVEFWDDRCMQVVPNTGRSLAEEVAGKEAELATLRMKWAESEKDAEWLAASLKKLMLCADPNIEACTDVELREAVKKGYAPEIREQAQAFLDVRQALEAHHTRVADAEY